MAPAEDVVAGRLPEVLAESQKRAGDLAWQWGVARRRFGVHRGQRRDPALWLAGDLRDDDFEDRFIGDVIVAGAPLRIPPRPG